MCIRDSGDGGAQAAPLRGAVPIAAALARADLREDLLAGIGDERGEQHLSLIHI